MTVAELIEALRAHDPSMTVVVDGYEADYCDSLGFEVVTVGPHDPDHSWWNGNRPLSREPDAERVLCLSRGAAST
jgi:hypothetical protein